MRRTFDRSLCDKQYCTSSTISQLVRNLELIIRFVDCYVALGFSLINIWSARGDGRSAQAQAGFQIAGLAVTLGIAIAGGVMTGKVLC